MKNPKNLNPFYNQKNKTNKSVKDYPLKFYLSNTRGLQSKIESVKSVVNSEKIDFCLITESQCSGKKNIKLPGFTGYFRNRVGKSKGGICLYVRDSWAPYCMKLESGEGNNEYFVVKVEAFSPALVIVVYYGVQENQYGGPAVMKMQSELFNTVKEHCDQGSTLVWAGDFNNHIGKMLGMKENTKDTSAGGKYLAQFIEEEGLTLLNTRDQAHTHVDETKGTSKVLDLVITNNGDNVSKFKVDSEYEITPYRVKEVKGKLARKHSDHIAISWTLTLKGSSSKRLTNKHTSWRYDKPGGNLKYEQETNRIGDEVENMLLSGFELKQIYEHIVKSVDDAKFEAYGKSTKTRAQTKRQSDSIIWRKRVKEIEGAVSGLKKVRLTDRIWEMKNCTSDKFDDKQFVSVQVPGSEKLTTSREETFATMMDYNKDLLQKDHDLLEEIEGEESTDAKEFIKKQILLEAMRREEKVEDRQFCEKEYWKVLRKIKLKNKNVYRDLTMSGNNFKSAMFKFFNACYVNEFTPDDFCYTTLMKLYKNKGKRTELKSNRFLHLKGWLPKTFEKLLMTKLEGRMSDHTPECQIGGQKLSSTNEHLLTAITLMRRLEKEQGGGGSIFMDIKACFDRIHLRDILVETAKAGIVGKPLRMIAEYTNNLKIRLQGDCDPDREVKIQNSTGQGSGFAPKGTSMTMAATLVEKIEMRSDEEKEKIISEVKGVPLEPEFFVDDLHKICANEDELAINGVVIDETLAELKLDAHPEKSGIWCLEGGERN